jgi:hypothetical protein
MSTYTYHRQPSFTLAIVGYIVGIAALDRRPKRAAPKRFSEGKSFS